MIFWVLKVRRKLLSRYLKNLAQDPITDEKSWIRALKTWLETFSLSKQHMELHGQTKSNWHQKNFTTNLWVFLKIEERKKFWIFFPPNFLKQKNIYSQWELLGKKKNASINIMWSSRKATISKTFEKKFKILF